MACNSWNNTFNTFKMKYKIELTKQQIILLKSLIDIGLNSVIVSNYKNAFLKINTQLNKGIKLKI